MWTMTRKGGVPVVAGAASIGAQGVKRGLLGSYSVLDLEYVAADFGLPPRRTADDADDDGGLRKSTPVEGQALAFPPSASPAAHLSSVES